MVLRCADGLGEDLVGGLDPDEGRRPLVLVTMHNPDLLHVYWDTWMAAYLKPFTPHFLRMNDIFTY